MRFALVLLLCTASSALASVEETPSSSGRYAVAAGTTAAGGAIGALIAVTAGLPLVYAGEAGLGQSGASGAALVLFLAVPFGAGFGAGAMVASFAEGPAPWLAGGTVGAATLLAFVIATSAIAEQVPETPGQQLGVAMVYAAPVITAAVIGALMGMLAVPALPEEPPS